MINIIDTILKTINGIPNFYTTDKQRGDIEIALKQLQTQVELSKYDLDKDIAKAVNKVNLADARSNRFIQYGWRPFIAWCCGLAIFYNFLLYPILEYISLLYKYPLPDRIDSTLLIPLVMGILGLGGMRSYEKNEKIRRINYDNNSTTTKY